MCGIVGYVGHRDARSVLLDGLERLEYRGYDSAGIAVRKDDRLVIQKKQGRLANLVSQLDGETAGSHLGIGHTRWATHGRPSDANSHPHTGGDGAFAVVHNGIIENYQAIRQALTEQGVVFSSETDTEVIPHLLALQYQGDLAEAVRRTVAQLEGSYAFCVIHRDTPDTMVVFRKSSPLVAGLGEGETFVASDIPAVLHYTRDFVVFEDGEMAVVTPAGIRVTGADGKESPREPQRILWDTQAAEKGGYPHFMIKEIFEQPEAIRKTLAGRIRDGRAALDLSMTEEQVRSIAKIVVIACGTAAYAGMVGRTLIERTMRIPVSVDVASEFRYMDPIVDSRTLALVISQSGETADTLAGLEEARARGARVLAITNVVGSSVAREADEVIYTQAGPEIAVASTKAYVTQLTALTLLMLWMGRQRGAISAGEEAGLVQALGELPEAVSGILDRADVIQAFADEVGKHDNVFFIGRGADYTASLEGALKLKEISYIHAEAYAAGELKHGTLALIEPGIPVIALATQEALVDKMISNIQEVRARGAYVIGFGLPDRPDLEEHCDLYFPLPAVHGLLAPVVTVIPLQMLAYYVSVARGNDVDKPRNLAKSVTVE